MSDEHGVGIEQARAFLIDRFGEAVGDLGRLNGGAWSTAYGYRVGTRGLVIRFSALEEDFRKDERAARNRSAALPIPPVLEIGEAFGGFYAISERAHGDFLEEVDEVRMRGLLPALFAALDAMRLADISATSGFGSWGADGTAGASSWRLALLAVANDRPTARIHGWSERLAGSPTGDRPFREAYRVLETLAASLAVDLPDPRHLIHSDLVNRNVLVTGSRITAVLDWGSALYGDFLFDLAWIRFWQPWYPAWGAIDFRKEAARHFEAIGLDVPRFEERLRACEIYIGLDGQVYQAFTRDWPELERTAARTLDIALRHA